MVAGQPLPFAATISKAADQAVVWSLLPALSDGTIQPPTGYGSIDPSTGMLQAPVLPGEYLVQAVSATDPTLWDRVPLQVTGRDGDTMQSNPMAFTIGLDETQSMLAYFSDAEFQWMHWAGLSSPSSKMFNNPQLFVSPAAV